MAEAAITSLLLKLGELAVSEAQLLLQVGDDIILLRDRLEWLQEIVRDADRKRRAGTDGLTRVWVRQTRDVVFEAEDALDDYFREEVVGLKSESCRQRWNFFCRKYFTGLFKKIVVQHGLSGRIKIIKSRLDQISENQKEYEIVHTPSMVLASSTTAIAAWRDDLENAVGFEQDVGILKQMIAQRNEHSPERPMFISIVGESGAGKNTLAKIIFREMRSQMEVLVWCNMEPGSNTATLLTEVYHRASLQCPDDCRPRVDEVTGLDIGDNLCALLTGRRYLLILGGISSKPILNCVRASLPAQDPDKFTDNGSHVMLILDTENEEVAWHANTMNRDGINGVHLLTRLDQKRSEDLFLWKVLRKGQTESSSSLLQLDRRREQLFIWDIFWKGQYKKESKNRNPKDDEYSRLVHDITGGYPMAIVLLAGLLRFKEKPVEWDAVLQQLISGFDGGKGLINRQPSICGTRRAMEMVFWASFEDLPNDLKSCFLYLASCHKSLSHPADNVVRMWIAEGFIKQSEDGKTMEELGHDYLKELVLRCLVEVEETKAGGGIELIRVHKSLMGLLQTEVREAGFMEIHDINNVLVPPSVRRLSVQSGNSRRYTSTFGNKKFPKLRSFICHIINQHHRHDLKFLCGSKFIRVISVQGLRLERLPNELSGMVNLRYLRIDCPHLCHLPSRISRLLNLQTLDIRNTKVDVIDLNFWKIKTLRHVLATDLTLPETMPVTVEDEGGGSELQTLHGVKPAASGEWIARNCPLDKMTSLRSLEIHGFQYEKHGGPTFEAALGNMQQLGHLKLQGDGIPACVLTDPSLRSLQTMVLHANLNWYDITADVLRRVRPNLVQLKMQHFDDIPESIKEQLGGILFKEDSNQNVLSSLPMISN